MISRNWIQLSDLRGNSSTQFYIFINTFDVFIQQYCITENGNLHAVVLEKCIMDSSGCRCATQGKEVRSPPHFLENRKKCSCFGNEGRNSDHLSIKGVVLRVSTRKNSQIFPTRAILSECFDSTKPPLPWKNSGCAPVVRLHDHEAEACHQRIQFLTGNLSFACFMLFLVLQRTVAEI